MLVTSAGPAIEGITHHVAAVNGAELHYVSAGTTGSPILLVHGFPETWWAFRKLIPLLAARHRVFAVDLRGFGDSSNAEGDYGSATSADDLHELDPPPRRRPGPPGGSGHQRRDGVPARRHPPGGRAELHRDRDGAGRLRTRRSRRRHPRRLVAHRRPRRPRHPRAAVRRPRTRAARRLGLPGDDRCRGRDHRGRRRRVRPLLRPSARLARRRRALPLDARGRRRDQGLAQSRPLGMPVLAVGAGGGTFTADTMAQVSAGDITSVQLEGVGHYAAQEAPERLSATILDFLSGVDGRAA